MTYVHVDIKNVALSKKGQHETGVPGYIWHIYGNLASNIYFTLNEINPDTV